MVRKYIYQTLSRPVDYSVLHVVLASYVKHKTFDNCWAGRSDSPMLLGVLRPRVVSESSVMYQAMSFDDPFLWPHLYIPTIISDPFGFCESLPRLVFSFDCH